MFFHRCQIMTDKKSGFVRVTAAVLEKDGRMIIAQRAAGDRLAGMWELPGGKIEKAESPEQCLARELREEFNLTISVGECLGTGTYRYDHMTIELLVYRVKWVRGEPTALVHADFRWVTPAELKHYEFAPADRPFIHKLEIGEIAIRSTTATG